MDVSGSGRAALKKTEEREGGGRASFGCSRKNYLRLSFKRDHLGKDRMNLGATRER